jgi:hypothetical protein
MSCKDDCIKSIWYHDHNYYQLPGTIRLLVTEILTPYFAFLTQKYHFMSKIWCFRETEVSISSSLVFLFVWVNLGYPRYSWFDLLLHLQLCWFESPCELLVFIAWLEGNSCAITFVHTLRYYTFIWVNLQFLYGSHFCSTATIMKQLCLRSYLLTVSYTINGG